MPPNRTPSRRVPPPPRGVEATVPWPRGLGHEPGGRQERPKPTRPLLHQMSPAKPVDGLRQGCRAGEEFDHIRGYGDSLQAEQDAEDGVILWIEPRRQGEGQFARIARHPLVRDAHHGGRLDQSERMTVHHLAELLDGNALVLAQRPAQFVLHEGAGRAGAQPGQPEGPAMTPRPSGGRGDDQRSGGQEAHQRVQLRGGAGEAVHDHHHAHRPHQLRQALGSRPVVRPRVVAGLEQLLPDVLGMTVGALEEHHVPASRDTVGGEPLQQGGLADTRRAHELHGHPGGGHVLELRQFAVPGQQLAGFTGLRGTAGGPAAPTDHGLPYAVLRHRAVVADDDKVVRPHRDRARVVAVHRDTRGALILLGLAQRATLRVERSRRGIRLSGPGG